MLYLYDIYVVSLYKCCYIFLGYMLYLYAIYVVSSDDMKNNVVRVCLRPWVCL